MKMVSWKMRCPFVRNSGQQFGRLRLPKMLRQQKGLLRRLLEPTKERNPVSTTS
jgi:hypothetical protein